jgi:hypothetical protein
VADENRAPVARARLVLIGERSRSRLLTSRLDAGVGFIPNDWRAQRAQAET